MNWPTVCLSHKALTLAFPDHGTQGRTAGPDLEHTRPHRQNAPREDGKPPASLLPLPGSAQVLGLTVEPTPALSSPRRALIGSQVGQEGNLWLSGTLLRNFSQPFTLPSPFSFGKSLGPRHMTPSHRVILAWSWGKMLPFWGLTFSFSVPKGNRAEPSWRGRGRPLRASPSPGREMQSALSFPS